MQQNLLVFNWNFSTFLNCLLVFKSLRILMDLFMKWILKDFLVKITHKTFTRQSHSNPSDFFFLLLPNKTQLQPGSFQSICLFSYANRCAYSLKFFMLQYWNTQYIFFTQLIKTKGIMLLYMFFKTVLCMHIVIIHMIHDNRYCVCIVSDSFSFLFLQHIF
jgi:hypothetical protein